MLAPTDYEIIEAENGEQALTLVRNLDPHDARGCPLHQQVRPRSIVSPRERHSVPEFHPRDHVSDARDFEHRRGRPAIDGSQTIRAVR